MVDSKSNEYNPLDYSIVQALFSPNYGKFEVPVYVEALIFYLLREIEYIFWNKNQKNWRNEADPWDYPDPGFEGIEVRSFSYADSEDPKDNEEAMKPNFKFSKVEIRWYKYPGRGMSCNLEMDEKQWREWFDECLTAISKNDPPRY